MRRFSLFPSAKRAKATNALGSQLAGLLEDHDDIQNVYANFDIPDEIMAEAE